MIVLVKACPNRLSQFFANSNEDSYYETTFEIKKSYRTKQGIFELNRFSLSMLNAKIMDFFLVDLISRLLLSTIGIFKLTDLVINWIALPTNGEP